MTENHNTQEPKQEDNVAPISTGNTTISSLAEPESKIKEEGFNVEKKQDETIAPSIEIPEQLKGQFEHVWDPETGGLQTDKAVEELVRQSKMAKDLRRKLSKGVNVPASEDAYYFEGKEASIDVWDNMDDGQKSVMMKAAFKNGLSQEQFNGMWNDVLNNLVEGGYIEKPMSPEEIESKKKAFVEKTLRELGPNGREVITANVRYKDFMVKTGIFSEKDAQTYEEILNMGSKHISLLNKIREASGEKPLPIDTDIIDGLPSDQEIGRRWSDYTPEEKEKIMEKRIKAGRSPYIPAEYIK